MYALGCLLLFPFFRACEGLKWSEQFLSPRIAFVVSAAEDPLWSFACAEGTHTGKCEGQFIPAELSLPSLLPSSEGGGNESTAHVCV